jgi:hypothetical protein
LVGGLTLVGGAPAGYLDSKGCASK